MLLSGLIVMCLASQAFVAVAFALLWRRVGAAVALFGIFASLCAVAWHATNLRLGFSLEAPEWWAWANVVVIPAVHSLVTTACATYALAHRWRPSWRRSTEQP